MPATRIAELTLPVTVLPLAAPAACSANNIPTRWLSLTWFPVSSGVADPPTWTPTSCPVMMLRLARPEAVSRKLKPTSPAPSMVLPSTTGAAEPATSMPTGVPGADAIATNDSRARPGKADSNPASHADHVVDGVDLGRSSGLDADLILLEGVAVDRGRGGLTDQNSDIGRDITGVSAFA